MRNIILLIFLSALFALPSFSAVKRVGDNYTEPEKPRHPYLKNTEIYYVTSDGERKEAEFDLYVLKTPIKDCKVCFNEYNVWLDNKICQKYNYRFTPCYPNYMYYLELSKARLTISKLLKRIDNCTIIPLMFDRPVKNKRLLGSMVRPYIYGEYDKLKKDALIDIHNQLVFMAQTYSLTKISKCGNYTDLFLSADSIGYSEIQYSIRKKELDYLTE